MMYRLKVHHDAGRMTLSSNSHRQEKNVQFAYYLCQRLFQRANTNPVVEN
jgi:hypothetical protein